MEHTKILIVDDEADIALILKLQLEDAGYVTLRARDGAEALRLLEREDFALVLLDIKMPRVDGMQVLEKLRSTRPNIAVIMMTAHGSEDIAVEAMKMGAMDYIAKPFSSDDLLGNVARTLELNRTRLENIRLQQQLEDERQKMEAILRGMADLLVAVDREGRVITLNGKAQTLLRVDVETCLGMPVSSLLKTDIPPDSLPCNVVLRTMAPCLDVTYQLQLGKTAIPVLSSATPLLSSHGELLGSVEIIRDISTLKALEHEKEEFVSMLTHDLKTPLTAVVGSIDLVREGRLGSINGEQKEYLEAAMDSCAEMVEMIDNLLDVYRFEANKVVLALTSEDSRNMLQRAITGFRSQAERSGIKLSAALQEDLPCLNVDRNKFLRLISNLLSNAFKFTPEGGEVTLHAEVVDGAAVAGRIPKELYPRAETPAGKHFLKISVQDTGIGIPPESLVLIFDKFVQAKTRGRGKNKGTGLGLAFCRKVTDAHGGFIWAESSEDQGSIFTALFPLEHFREET